MRKQELHPRTAVLNKTQKNQSRQARQKALLWLAASFPEAFDNSLRIRPLKTGIMTDILEHAEDAAEQGISKSKLREAVILFTRRIDYLICLKARESRIDLQGQLAGEVSEEEAAHATMKIKKRVEKSARNARKNLQSKPFSHHTNRSSSSTAHPPRSNYRPTTQHAQQNEQPQGSNEHYLPIYPPRPSYSNTHHTTSQQTKPAAAVIVKHKPSRQYDPTVVARLKEKLGLSRSAGKKEEPVE